MSIQTPHRLQGLALLAVSLIVMTVSLVCWTLARELSIEKQTLRSHFEHTIEDIRMLESTLLKVINLDEIEVFPAQISTMRLEQISQPPASGLEMYTARTQVTGISFQVAFPSSDSQNSHYAEANALSTLGLMASARFLRTLHDTELGGVPMALFDIKNDRKILFGCTGATTDTAADLSQSCLPEISRLTSAVQARDKNKNRLIHWDSAPTEPEHSQIAAYAKLDRHIDQNPILDGDWWIVSTLAIGHSHQIPNVPDEFGGTALSFEIISPEGKALTPRIEPPGFLIPSLGLIPDSSILRLQSTDGWTVNYRLSHLAPFKILAPQLATLAALVLLCCLAAWAFSKWYYRRYYEPLHVQRRRTEESEAFARGVIDVAQVAMCVIDRQNGLTLRANALASDWLGDKNELNRLGRAWISTYALGPQKEESAALHIRSRHLSGYFAHARYEDRDALLCTFSDISMHVHAQEALSSEKAVSDRANAAKSAFLATMSHEIRTPLYGVLGTLELLADTPLSFEQKSYLDTTQQSAGILLGIIGDVLDMSKIESGVIELNLEEFSPLQLTETVAQAYRATAANKGLSINCVLSPNAPRLVRGDADRIRQVLNNLVSNAIKFTELGRIRISLEMQQVHQQQATLIWRVVDTGIGISRDDLPSLFDPFFQVHGEPGMSSGTGLGLTICKKLVELMGGVIEVVSEVGLGSTFTVTMPLPIVDPAIAVSPSMNLDNIEVFIRAPTIELRRYYRQWLERWNVRCDVESAASELSDERGILLHVSPSQMPTMTWSGMQIIVTESASLDPRGQPGLIRVNSYSLAALARALEMASGSKHARAEEISEDMPSGFTDDNNSAARPTRALALRVLVAEDSAINQEVLKRQLTSLGCSVTLCCDGIAALRAWSDDKFDILMTDVNMPGLGGPDLINRLRSQGMEKPIVCITANAQPAASWTLEQSGVNAWLVKPIRLQALQNCLLKLTEDLQTATVEPQTDAALNGSDPGGIDDFPAYIKDIFLATMKEDAALIRKQLSDREHAGLRESLHRVRGGLVMGNRDELAALCHAIEDQLQNNPMAPDLLDRGWKFLQTLEDLLVRLQAQKTLHQDDAS